ncbi:MATE family efflux transporter [uncultured Sphingomonas sp.]|uniref:MATE family efflux transporter n=1 Tax=uncultured Sphingomonas sp. TaxID=158754 RepID=UPI0035CC246F
MSAAAILPADDTAASATWREELRALGRLAGPLVGANLLQMAVYAVDVVFVARLGEVEFAAATLGVYLYGLVLWALTGLTGAVAPIVAAELGQRRHAVREVRRSFRMGLWLAALAGAPFLLLLAQGEWLLGAAGQDPRVAARADAFLDILLWALIPAVATGVMRTLAAALGRPGYALAIAGVAVGVAVLANWLLVFGAGPVPALGLEGAALASLATSALMMVAYLAVLLLDPKLRRYRLFGRWWRPEGARLAEIVRLGLPIAATITFEGALFGGAGLLMGLIGVTEVAAHAVALNIAAVAFQIPLGVGQAATIRVGMAYGAADRAWIARAGWTALAVGTGFMAVTSGLILLAPRPFVSVYLDVDDPANARAVALALQFLVLAAMFQLFDGAQAVAAGVLRGLQDTRVPMLIALVGYWAAGFGVAVLLGFGAGWGGVGIWTGLAVGLAVVSVLLGWRWTARERLGLLPTPA